MSPTEGFMMSSFFMLNPTEVSYFVIMHGQDQNKVASSFFDMYEEISIISLLNWSRLVLIHTTGILSHLVMNYLIRNVTPNSLVL